MKEHRGYVIYEPGDAAVLEARRLLEGHGIVPGPDGYTSDQLRDELESRGWNWKLNEDDPLNRPDDPPSNYACATKRYTPSSAFSIHRHATFAADALALVLTSAIVDDEREHLG